MSTDDLLSVTELLIGTYEGGVCRIRKNGSAPEWVVSDRYDDVRDASYMAYNHRCGVHYAVDEEAAEVVAFRVGRSGLEVLERVASGGAAPCFVSIDAPCTALAVANYKSGSVSVFRLDAESGRFLASPSVFENAGSGADAERQDRPHAHCVQFHDGALYSTDLGTDEVLRHVVGETGDLMRTEATVTLPPGQGPRHIVFHPRAPVAYVLTELGSSLFVLGVGEAGLSEMQRLSTLPTGFDGESLGGHLALNAAGDRLYASNRGHDSIATFAVGEDGRLELLGVAPTHRSSPRHFLVLEAERQVVVAHEKDGLVVLALNADGMIGAVVDAHEIPKAAFVGLVSAERRSGREGS